MTDKMSREQRHRCMAAIKGKDTKPEMMVRRYLFSRGLRYRVNVKKLPGSPDIVLKKYGVAVFIDGCFWHGHKECKYYKLPSTNIDFWKAKVAKNQARDYVNNVDLELDGWRVIRIWECEIKTKEQREDRLSRLYDEIVSGTRAYKLKRIRKKKIRQYDDYPDDFNIAAEEEVEY
ncbi:MAG: very short patch repair endonuclease [Muribaculaceae bacterium]|nr:very short patch repair endonuclease [Muribaculaceae bacterium]